MSPDNSFQRRSSPTAPRSKRWASVSPAERKASSRVFLEQEFLKAGVTLTPEIELSSRQLLVTLAGIGLGVAGVTLEFVRKDLESGDIRLLKTDFTIPERSVDMCTLKEVPPTAAATAFMEMVRKGV